MPAKKKNPKNVQKILLQIFKNKWIFDSVIYFLRQIQENPWFFQLTITYVFLPKFQKMVPKRIAETVVNVNRTRL